MGRTKRATERMTGLSIRSSELWILQRLNTQRLMDGAMCGYLTTVVAMLLWLTMMGGVEFEGIAEWQRDVALST